MKPWDDPRVARGMKAQLAKRRERIGAGEAPLGWKLGMGVPAMMERLKITAPLVGFLMQRALVAPGSTVSFRGWSQPVAEPEIAVRMAKDLTAGSERATVLSAIASLQPAIELADLDQMPTPENLESVLAGDIFQRHVILGEKTRAGGSTAGISARVFRRDKEVARTSEPEALTGKVADIVSHVANMLSAFGEKLSAGDIIICGTIVPPPLIEPDETGFAYALDPIGDVSVRFSRL